MQNKLVGKNFVGSYCIFLFASFECIICSKNVACLVIMKKVKTLCFANSYYSPLNLNPFKIKKRIKLKPPTGGGGGGAFYN